MICCKRKTRFLAARHYTSAAAAAAAAIVAACDGNGYGAGTIAMGRQYEETEMCK